jgi:uncharacterized protein
MEIDIFDLKDVDLRDATIVDGMPSVGLVSTIAANHLVSILGLDQVAVMDADDFPPISVIYGGQPKHPARLYASEELGLVVMFSEFTAPPRLARPIVRAIRSWAEWKGCKGIISLEGVPTKSLEHKEKPYVFGVGATEEARIRLLKCNIPQLQMGIISGTTGVFLNEARLSSLYAIALLVEAHPDIPDYLGAAALVDHLGSLMNLDIDSKTLLAKGREQQDYIEDLREEANKVVTSGSMAMYR